MLNNISAGDGNRTREETTSLGPQPSAFDRSTTPAYKKSVIFSDGFIHLDLKSIIIYFNYHI